MLKIHGAIILAGTLASLAGCASDSGNTPPPGSAHTCPPGSRYVPASERPTPGSPACQPIEPATE